LTHSLGRYASLTGILFVVLLVVGFTVGGDSPSADNLGEIAKFWKTDDSKQMIAAGLVALSTVPLIIYAGCLRSALRGAEGPSGGWSSVVFGSLVVTAATVIAAAAIHFAIADNADDLTVVQIQTLNAIDESGFFLFGIGIAMTLFTFGIAALRTKAFPTWLAVISLIVGIVGLTPAGFIGFALSGVWFIVISIMLVQRGSNAAAPPAAPPAAA
jgi:hypothetical protein